MTLRQPEQSTPDFVWDWRAWHRDQETRLAAPHGFLAATALHWLGAEPRRFPDVPGAWTSDETGVSVQLDEGEELALDGVALSGRHDVGPIPERGGLVATCGEVELEVARRGDHDVLRPRHPGNPLLTEFRGTPAYEPDPRWRLTGRYVAHDAPRPTTVGSVVDGLEHVYDAPGAVEVEIAGSTHRLTVFDARDGGFLLLFTDETSGLTTYAANRSLAIAAPGPDGSVVLDLNRASNLPCAYTDLATCPLPPAGNHLPVAVEAGERTPLERAGRS